MTPLGSSIRPPTRPRARARLLALAGTFGIVTALLAPACGFDWTVRSDSSDGGPQGETSRPDVTVGDTGTDAPVDAPRDVEGDVNDPCTALKAQVAAKKDKARSCTLTSGHCMTTVDDECGCKVVVRLPGTQDNTAYASAIAELKASCAAELVCAGCPVLPTPWSCLFNNGVPVCNP